MTKGDMVTVGILAFSLGFAFLIGRGSIECPPPKTVTHVVTRYIPIQPDFSNATRICKAHKGVSLLVWGGFDPNDPPETQCMDEKKLATHRFVS